MSTVARSPRHRSIFSPATSRQRAENFEDYWSFSQRHAGQIIEQDKDLTKKRDKLRYFQENPVRSRQPLPDPEVFYRNYVHLTDDPTKIDRKTLMLMCIYKFARHEWVGISGAWDRIPPMAKAKKVTDKISRYHLAEEFCHVRFFHEMFRVFHLDRVEWVPLGPVMQSVYKVFPYVPGAVMDPPAFVTELMGITFYLHLDKLFDDVLADEPEARERLRALLSEIIVDEIAHAGQRRNFIGPLGMKASKMMVAPLYRAFFNDIPESKHLFDVDKMIEDGLAFDYSAIPPALLSRSWIPSYCQ
jgi:hypothetical protein